MYEIIPGILEKEWSEIEKKINLVKPFAKSLHVDIIDGKFAPNTTFLDPQPFKKYSQDLFLEAHLMVDNPITYLKPLADAGFKRFLGHVETISDQVEFVAQAQILGEVGLVLDSNTQIEALKVPLEDLDNILIMTVKTGFSGQSFNPQNLEKIRIIRAKSETLPIEVDGGINDKTILLAKDAGATRFITSSFLFKSNNPKKQYQILENLLG